MAWKGVITNGGNTLFASWVTGATLNFDAAEGGTGTVAESALLAQTALTGKRQNLSLIAAEKVGNGVRLTVQITPPQTGYTLNQVGIFASVDGGTKVLVALLQDTAGIAIPGVSEIPDFFYKMFGVVQVSNTGAFTLTVDTSAAVNMGTLDTAIATHNSAADAHGDMRAEIETAQTAADKGIADAAAAKTAAQNAQTTADQAKTAAQGAQQTADKGVSDAAAAKTAAQNAQTTADQAITNAQGAQQTADKGVSDAAAAKTAAQNAQTTADQAKTAAQGAQQTADKGVSDAAAAQLAADNAKTAAQNAQTTANEAKTAAQAAQTTANQKEDKANKGAAGGFAGLDSNKKILLENLPDTILGQLLNGGTVNASTAVATLSADAKTRLGTTAATITLTNNTTAITGYAANKSIFYITETAGTFAGISFDVGDWLLSIGTAWRKIDNTDAVMGVKGNAESTYRIGNVNLTAANVGAEALIKDAAAKTTLVDADTIPLSDSAASNATKRITWANIKTALKTYFDALFVPVTRTINGKALSANIALDAADVGAVNKIGTPYGSGAQTQSIVLGTFNLAATTSNNSASLLLNLYIRTAQVSAVEIKFAQSAYSGMVVYGSELPTGATFYYKVIAGGTQNTTTQIEVGAVFTGWPFVRFQEIMWNQGEGAWTYAIKTGQAATATYSNGTAITTGTAVTPALKYAAYSHIGATGAAHGVATSSASGFMSPADKAKLDGRTVQTYTATLTTTWSGASAPYTQTVTVSGILATDNPIVDVGLSEIAAIAKLQLEAWSKVGRIVTANGAITAYCYDEKPTTAIVIQLKVVR